MAETSLKLLALLTFLFAGLSVLIPSVWLTDVVGGSDDDFRVLGSLSVGPVSRMGAPAGRALMILGGLDGVLVAVG